MRKIQRYKIITRKRNWKLQKPAETNDSLTSISFSLSRKPFLIFLKVFLHLFPSSDNILLEVFTLFKFLFTDPCPKHTLLTTLNCLKHSKNQKHHHFVLTYQNKHLAFSHLTPNRTFLTFLFLQILVLGTYSM